MRLQPNIWLGLAVTGGAIVGLGLYLLVMRLIPARPALGPALRRLHPMTAPGAVAIAAQAQARGSTPWTAQFRPPASDLNILDRTAERHLVSVGLSAGLGFMLPTVAAVMIIVLRLDFPLAVPLGLSLLLAIGLGAMAHYDMRAKATSARSEFRRALCTYAALTAHQVRSGHGAVEAMERSARICDGWAYGRLRTALLTAQLQMRTPWDELKTLAAAIDVIELASFSDIMRSAGADGAQVYQTLRAQATSLQDQMRAKTIEQAKTRTSKLDIPATMLIVVLLGLVGYPLISNLLSHS